MSNHTTAAAEIKRAWLFAWNAGTLSSIPVEHANQRFQQPKNGPWGRLTLQTGKTTPAAIGGQMGKLDRTPFILSLQMFLPENSGTSIAQQAADCLKLLDRATINHDNLAINFDTAGYEAAPNPANTGIVAYNCEISGFYDITYPVQDFDIDGGLPGTNYTYTSPLDGGSP
jgi:hypothetical protein